MNFESKLPGDVLKRKAAVKQLTRTLDLREKEPERIVGYSDHAFFHAAIKWLRKHFRSFQPFMPLQYTFLRCIIDILLRVRWPLPLPSDTIPLTATMDDALETGGV